MSPPASGLTGRLARAVLEHRRIVALIWLVVLAASLAVVVRVPGRLGQQFVQPGTTSFVANAAIARIYGSGGSGSPLVVEVVTPAASPSWAIGPDPFRRLEGVRGIRFEDYATTRARVFLGRAGDLAVQYALVFTPPTPGLNVPASLVAEIRQAASAGAPRGTRVEITGLALLQQGATGSPGSQVLVESAVGGAGALVVLALVFGSLLAVLPLAVAVVSVLTSFLLLFGLTFLTQVNFIALFLIGLIGLGVAIDYSLLVVTRWREELGSGRTNEEAVLVAVTRAGRSVAFSGVTVAISLAALIFLPVSFLRSLGFAGLFIPLVSIAVALSVLPLLLVTLGPRLDRHRVRRRRHEAGTATATKGGWWAWAGVVVRHRQLAVVVSLAALVPLSVATLGLKLGDAGASSLASRGPAAAGLTTLERAKVPSGVLTPIEVLVRAPARLGAVRHAVLARSVGIAAVLPPAPGAEGAQLLEVVPDDQSTQPAGTATVRSVRAALAGEPGVAVGGSGATQVDFVDAVYGDFPLVVGLIGLLTFLLLAVALRSLLLPLKALVLNALSVTAAYGVMVLVWQDGYGSSFLANLPATGAITAWIPLMVFAFLFGLSMDYEVFLLARMREAYDGTGDTNAGVVEGLARTGRLVTGAALILFLSFVSLASNPFTFLKVFATGLAAGILLDAVIVRSLLAPALVSLFGKANWWLPGPLRSWANRASSAPGGASASSTAVG